MKYVITPPRELVAMWAGFSARHHSAGSVDYVLDLATKAAQWGADQELEACCEWLEQEVLLQHQYDVVPALRDARRPKPPSLKEQALEIVRRTPVNSAGLYSYEHIEIIRRALEQLDD
jgi:hypothetical protein